MHAHNPARIPRNHQVERAIAAGLEGDLEPFRLLHAALRHPYDDDPTFAEFEAPPAPDEVVHQTFCGT